MLIEYTDVSICSSSLRFRAFSLLELLVTTALIAILLSLLFVVVRQLRETASVAHCANNLKQLSQIVFTYATDRNGELLPCLRWYSNVAGKPWHMILDELGYLDRASWDLQKNNLMCCPSRKDPPQGAQTRLHYGMNTFPGFDNRLEADERSRHLAEISKPGETLLMADADFYYVMPAEPEKVVFAHNGRANVVFMDGHIESLSGPFPKYGYYSNRNNLREPDFAPPYYRK